MTEKIKCGAGNHDPVKTHTFRIKDLDVSVEHYKCSRCNDTAIIKEEPGCMMISDSLFFPGYATMEQPK